MDERTELPKKEETANSGLNSGEGQSVSDLSNEIYTDEYDNYCPWEL